MPRKSFSCMMMMMMMMMG